MNGKGQWLFGMDVLNTVLLLVLAATGIIIKWVLPPGMGRYGRGGNTLLGLTRHDWGDLHIWVALIFVASVIVHLAMHTGFIRTMIKPHHASALPASKSI